MANFIYGTFVIVLLMMVDFSYTQIESLCPEVLLYIRGEKGLYGDVTVPSKSIGNNKEMNLTVILLHEESLPSQYEGHIELIGEQSTVLLNVLTKVNPIRYIVIFPMRTQYFYIKSIDFNGDLLCNVTYPSEANRKIVLRHNMVIDETEINQLEEPTRSIFHNPTVASETLSKKESTRFTHQNLTRKILPQRQSTSSTYYYPISDLIFVSGINRSKRSLKSSKVRRFAKSEQNPHENYSSLFNQKQLRKACGNENNDSNRKWPWITAVYIEGVTGWRAVSSGALISDIFVITAAQPVSLLNDRPTQPEELSVRVGANNLEDEADESSSPRIVQEIIYHPGFKPIRLKVQDNIALLRIQPLNFNQFLSPVCLIRSSRDIGSEVIKGQVLGWGKRLENTLNVHFNEIEMEILPFDKCKTAHPLIPRFLKPNNFCAQSKVVSELCDEQQGKGFYIRKRESTRWVLAGLLSYSTNTDIGNCKIDKTRLFSDLSKDADWIEEIMFPDNY